MFTTKLQTNNCQLQLTGYYIDDSCYNYSFHIQLCYIFSIFSQKFFSTFSMVPESKNCFPFFSKNSGIFLWFIASAIGASYCNM